jgi:nicotinate dehydrogenase subunit B
MNIQISRRDALLGSGALIVSFALADSLTGVQAQGGAKPLALTEVDSFLAIDKTGKVTVYSGKVDLGTGITTALRQIVADELDVPLNRIELVQGDTLLTPDQGKTWASVTIQVGGMQLRQAAAALWKLPRSSARTISQLPTASSWPAAARRSATPN